MNNKFVKVLNEPKAVLLLAAMQRKQQRCTFEILYISKESCMVIDIVYVSHMRRMRLSVYRKNSNVQWVLCTKFLNSEFSDRVVLFVVVILIQRIPNALLISVTLYSCFRRIDRRM